MRPSVSLHASKLLSDTVVWSFCC